MTTKEKKRRCILNKPMKYKKERKLQNIETQNENKGQLVNVLLWKGSTGLLPLRLIINEQIKSFKWESFHFPS